MEINLTFLGTGQAIPTAEKNHLSVLLQYESENILIDCGEGTQRQLKKAKLNACKITRILITHWHGDHVLGLPGLFQTLALNNYSKTLYIHGPKGTEKFVKELLRIFIFKEKLDVKVHEIEKDGIFFDSKKFKLEAYKQQHSCPCVSYSFIEKDRRKINMPYLKKLGLVSSPLIGKLQEGKSIKFKNKPISVTKATSLIKGRKITFILDTLFNKNTIKAAKNSTLLVSEACFSETEKDKAIERKHLTATEAATVAKKSKSESLIILHISQRYDKQEHKILKEAQSIFKKTGIAKDLDEIIL